MQIQKQSQYFPCSTVTPYLHMQVQDNKYNYEPLRVENKTTETKNEQQSTSWCHAHASESMKNTNSNEMAFASAVGPRS